jgi:hypothetical protein
MEKGCASEQSRAPGWRHRIRATRIRRGARPARGILDQVSDATLRATLSKLGEQGFELLMAAVGA